MDRHVTICLRLAVHASTGINGTANFALPFALQYRPRPGKFEGVPPEEAESLQRELTAIASPGWAALLFHKDFKRHLEAAEQLVANLADLLEEVQASLDLILRWAVLRICDGNMQASRVEGGLE